jgi:hypothetical protein
VTSSATRHQATGLRDRRGSWLELPDNQPPDRALEQPGCSPNLQGAGAPPGRVACAGAYPGLDSTRPRFETIPAPASLQSPGQPSRRRCDAAPRTTGHSTRTSCFLVSGHPPRAVAMKTTVFGAGCLEATHAACMTDLGHPGPRPRLRRDTADTAEPSTFSAKVLGPCTSRTCNRWYANRSTPAGSASRHQPKRPPSSPCSASGPPKAWVIGSRREAVHDGDQLRGISTRADPLRCDASPLPAAVARS